MKTERTLALIKPDAVARGLSGTLLMRIEAKGYVLLAMTMTTATREQLAEHYAEHIGKPFYEPLVQFMGSSPLIALVLGGHQVIQGLRALIGATDPTTAAPGSLRGDYGRAWGGDVQQNLIHASDSVDAAQREIGLWFPQCSDSSRVVGELP